jgi:hypothetical protein
MSTCLLLFPSAPLSPGRTAMPDAAVALPFRFSERPVPCRPGRSRSVAPNAEGGNSCPCPMCKPLQSMH